MGVHGLWQLLQPVGRPVTLESLQGKRLAIDSSIWLYHFQMAMRDKEGRTLANAHLLGFLWRILKLLFYAIKPVFVFDGGAPVQKRRTLANRKHRRTNATDSHARAAERLLAAQLRQAALRSFAPPQAHSDEVLDDGTVYYDSVGRTNRPQVSGRLSDAIPAPLSASSVPPKRNFHKDPYQLPDLPHNALKETSNAKDLRFATEDELRDMMNSIAPEDLDMNSEFFKSLPPELQYELVGDLRLQSRGTSFKRLRAMLAAAPTPIDFSRAQIAGLKTRNDLTQKVLTVTDEIGNANIKVPLRVAGARNREYVLQHIDSGDGGFALGSRDAGMSRDKAINVDDEDPDVKPAQQHEDEEIDPLEMEDVEIGPTTPRKDPELETLIESETDPVLRKERAIELLVARAEQHRRQRRKEAGIEALEERNFGHITSVQDDKELFHGDVEVPDKAPAVHRMIPAAVSIPNTALLKESHRNTPVQLNDDDFEDVMMAHDETNASKACAPDEPARMNHNLIANEPKGLDSVDNMPHALAKNQEQHESTAAEAKAKDKPQLVDSATLPVCPATADVQKPKAIQSLERPCDVHVVMQAKNKPGGSMHTESEQASTPDVAPTPEKSLSEVAEIPAEQGATPDGMASTPEKSLSEVAEIPVEQSVSPTMLSEPPRESIRPDDTAMSLWAIPDHAGRLDSTDLLSTTTDSDKVKAPLVPLPTSPSVTERDESDKRKALSTPQLISLKTPEYDKSAEDFFEWSPSPSPEKPPLGPDGFPLPTSEEVDDMEEQEESELAQLEMDQTQFASFLSATQGRSLEEMQQEVEAEVDALRRERARLRRNEEDITAQMAAEIQAMLRLFGLPYLTAPMEAEAQCAELASLKLVDGIITDDSDVFLFGGTPVYRNMFNPRRMVECYRLGDVQRELGLSRERLIQLAFLLGSDYTEGLTGVGPVMAMEILLLYPGERGLEQFREWWQQVQIGADADIHDNRAKVRKRIKRTLRDKVHLTNDWPDPTERQAYIEPIVDSSDEPFVWGTADLDAVRVFLGEYLHWPTSKTDQYVLPVIEQQRRTARLNRLQATLDQAGFVRGSVPVPHMNRFGSTRLQQVVNEFREASCGDDTSRTTEDELLGVGATPATASKQRRSRKRRANEGGGDDDDYVPSARRRAQAQEANRTASRTASLECESPNTVVE